MIVSHKNDWCICTPCKTGTMSLEATLRKRAPVAEQWGGRHNYDCLGMRRIMVVRHPLDRWYSMFWFINKHIGKSCYMQDWAHDINVFAEEWAKRCEAKELHWWFYNQAFMAEHFTPHVVFKLEDDLERVLDYLRAEFQLELPRVSCTNVNHHYGSQTLSPENLRLVYKYWVEPDCARFGYEAKDILH